MNPFRPTVAIITGVTGQDGAYLAQLLIAKGYIVFGTYHNSDPANFWRLRDLGIHSNPNLRLVEYSLADLSTSIRLLEISNADEIYNLAANSFVGTSFDQPIKTAKTIGIGAVYLLEAIRIVNPKIRFYQASTSEMFGKAQTVPQTESTSFYPRSPYGAAKLYAHWMTVNYRENYGIFGASGILYNHESPLRSRAFVTRKVSDSVAKIKLGKLDSLELGNIDAKRDWGFAKDYVLGMWKMLQVDEPDTFILATNRTETVRNFVNLSFEAADIHLEWSGQEENEKGICIKTGKTLVKINPKFYRPAELNLLIGNPEKAEKLLGWKPTTSLKELCTIMVKTDIARNELIC